MVSEQFPDDIEELVTPYAEAMLEAAGREVQIITARPATEYDEQGDPLPAGSDTATTHAEFVERGSPNFAERAEGYEITVDAVAWIPKSVRDRVDITTGEGDREQEATQIRDPASGRWRIEYVVAENNGKLRCVCRRIAR